MNKKKIIAIAGALIAACLIVAVSIPALGSRNRQNVTEPPVKSVNEKQENTTPNDVSDDGAAQPTESKPANGDNDEGDDPETPVDGNQEETPPEPAEAGKSGEETSDDTTPPAEDETSDSEIVPRGEDDSRKAPKGATNTVTDPVKPPEDDKTEPKVDPDDIPAEEYGPGIAPEESSGLTPEEEEMIRQANEKFNTSEEEEKRLRELFGEDGMSGY